jgi:hypothetical protein
VDLRGRTIWIADEPLANALRYVGALPARVWKGGKPKKDASLVESSSGLVAFECPILSDFFGMKKSGDTPLMLPAPTARRVPTETGLKLRVGSELTTIKRLPVCNLGDHVWSE